jgi:cytochrome P450
VKISREAAEDVVIQGVHIPKGASVLISPAAFHHNPAIWGEDCDEFKPDRWNKLATSGGDHTFAAFSMGPRVCIGKAMAMIDFKVVMMELLRRFDFHLQGPNNLKFSELKLYNPSEILRPKGGLKVHVTKHV